MFFTPIARTRTFAPTFRAVDRNFEHFVRDALQDRQRPVALEQDEKTWTLRLDTPGVTREQLNVSIEGAVVRIETLADAPRQYRAAYQLPEDIDASASNAKLEHGVLILTLAKPQPASKVTQVAVN